MKVKYNNGYMSPRSYKVFAKLEWLKDDKTPGTDKLFPGMFGEIEKSVSDISDNSPRLMKKQRWQNVDFFLKFKKESMKD